MGQDETRKIIKGYKKRPVLWNKTERNYGKKSATNSALKDLAKEMNMSLEKCIAKVKNMRYSYSREKARKLKAKANGTVYVPTWYAYKMLAFLDDHLQPVTFDCSKEDHYKPSSSKNEDLRLPRAMQSPSKQSQVQDETRKSKRITSRNEKSMIQSEIVSSQDTSTIEDENADSLSLVSEAENRGVGSFLDGKIPIKIENIYMDSDSEIEHLEGDEMCHEEMTFENENCRSVFRNEVEVDPIQCHVHDKSDSTFHGMPVIVNCRGNASSDLSHGLQAANRSWMCSGEDEECQSYGVYIGNKLRNYSKSMRSKVQHAFSNIIFSADQGDLDPV